MKHHHQTTTKRIYHFNDIFKPVTAMQKPKGEFITCNKKTCLILVTGLHLFDKKFTANLIGVTELNLLIFRRLKLILLHLLKKHKDLTQLCKKRLSVRYWTLTHKLQFPAAFVCFVLTCSILINMKPLNYA